MPGGPGGLPAEIVSATARFPAFCAQLSLKPRAHRTDTPGMFSTFLAEPLAAGTRLRALRLSLNTPVVSMDALPVGPAAAGVALHNGPGGVLLTLAVRSVRTGQLVFFRPDDDWGELHGQELAVDAALSFAEGMGFLFDEDPIAAGEDPRAAAQLWADFLQEAMPDWGPGAEGEEAWLDQGVEAAPPLLSKFRWIAVDAAAPPQRAAAAGRDLWVRLLSRF